MYIPLCVANSFIATVFTIVVLISANDSDDVLRDLNWSNGDFYVDLNTDATIWISIYQYGYGNKDEIVKIDWSSYDCYDDFCSECQSAMKIVLSFLILFFVLSFASMIIAAQRCILTGNTSKAKNLSMFFSFLQMCCGVVSLIEFSSGCERHVKDYYRDHTSFDITWFYGPSYGLLIAAASLSFINLWCHWRTPITEDVRSEEYHRGLLDNSK